MGELPSRTPGRFDVAADRKRLWDVISNGGIAIVPTNLGYGLSACTVEAVNRINAAKGRGAHKRNGMLMGFAIEPELHILDSHQRDIVDCVTKDYNLPLGVIAPYRADHPILQNIDPAILKTCTARGTMSTALNTGGPFNEHIARLSLEHLRPVFGSSANLTGQGGKVRVEDIEPEIIAIADLVLDYGLAPLHHYRIASTQINFATMKVNRYGAFYDVISDILKRHFDWDLPVNPGREVSPHGLVNEFELRGVD